MASSANCRVWAFIVVVNRSDVSGSLFAHSYKGVYVACPLTGRSLSAQMYSPAGGRSFGGYGSHRKRRSFGTFIFEHSANVLTRLYRNGPEDSDRAYWPVAPWNQMTYAPMGITPATARVARRRQPTRL